MRVAGAVLFVLVAAAFALTCGGDARPSKYDCAQIVDFRVAQDCYSEVFEREQPSLDDCLELFVPSSELQRRCVERTGLGEPCLVLPDGDLNQAYWGVFSCDDDGQRR